MFTTDTTESCTATSITTNPEYGPYSVIASGVNSKGNHYRKLDYGDGSNSFEYENTCGSFYKKNPDSSDFYNNGRGMTRFTPAPVYDRLLVKAEDREDIIMDPEDVPVKAEGFSQVPVVFDGLPVEVVKQEMSDK